MTPSRTTVGRYRRVGEASGWNCLPGKYGWRWSAYGPRGGETGRAQTEQEAIWMAQRAAERLSRPIGPLGQ